MHERVYSAYATDDRLWVVESDATEGTQFGEDIGAPLLDIPHEWFGGSLAESQLEANGWRPVGIWCEAGGDTAGVEVERIG